MIAKPERHRCPAHLRYVASIGCIACSGGRLPGSEWMDRGPVSQAHHITYAQPRARGLKTSDAYTVPVCAIDHARIHEAGGERVWWQARGIDPLPIAERLWRASVEAGRVKPMGMAV